jgi:hypothetical protein
MPLDPAKLVEPCHHAIMIRPLVRHALSIAPSFSFTHCYAIATFMGAILSGPRCPSSGDPQ